MRIPYLPSLLVLASALACKNPRDRARDTLPTRAMVAAAAADTEGLWCRGDTTVRRDDPGKLVREFVARDGAGEFLGTSSFWLSATDCAGEGTDGAEVIASYSIDSLGTRDDTARFRVTYRLLGDLVQRDQGRFDPRIKMVVDTFLVVRRPWSWRIVGEHDLPMVLAESAKTQWQLAPDDRARLDSAARVSAHVAPN